MCVIFKMFQGFPPLKLYQFHWLNVMSFNYISFLALSYGCVTRAKIINLSASLSIQLLVSILRGNVCNNALVFPLYCY